MNHVLSAYYITTRRHKSRRQKSLCTALLIANLRPVLTIDRDMGVPRLTVDSKSANTVAALDRILAISGGISGDVQELCETIWLATDTGASIGDSDEIIYEYAGSFHQPVFQGMAHEELTLARLA